MPVIMNHILSFHQVNNNHNNEIQYFLYELFPQVLPFVNVQAAVVLGNQEKIQIFILATKHSALKVRCENHSFVCLEKDNVLILGYSIKYPIRHGIVEDWDLMETYWEHCLFKYLRCDPGQSIDICFFLFHFFFFSVFSEDHYFLLVRQFQK